MSRRKLFVVYLTIAFLACLIAMLSGCGKPETIETTVLPETIQGEKLDDVQPISHAIDSTELADSSPTETPAPKVSPKPTTEPTPAPTTEPTPEPTKSPIEQLSPTQRNSINMLNYLTVLVQEINSSTNSRMFLESAYSELINNTEPSIVDDLTLDEYEKILSVIEKYRMVAVKRDRLQYIYEQNSASAIRSAMPNPIALLNVVQSGNPLKSIVSVAYLALDSVSSYNSYTNGLDLQYLQDGWALDDEEAANLHDSRTSMFSYMVRISRDLPRGLTLSEDAVTEFVMWSNETNTTSKIRWLESNQNTYKYYGEYWLVLADSYYDAEKYEKCLSAVDTYESLDNSIFRRDIRLAQTLPNAIVAARETLNEKEYETNASRYVQLILNNTYNSDWSLRYFTAQTLIDLYAKTNNIEYLSQAFEIVYDNVNELVKKQPSLNETYLADVALKSTKNVSKDEKEEIENYNDLLKETRKTELPPIYEPLRLNCDLLFALADKLNISTSKKTDINDILHSNGEPLFLSIPVDNAYLFNSTDSNFSENDIEISYEDDKINLPTSVISENATIVATINDGSSSTIIDDWEIEKVDRNKSNNIDDFVATYKSQSLKKYSYNDGTTITVTINPVNQSDMVKPINIIFKVEKVPFAVVLEKTAFTRVYDE